MAAQSNVNIAEFSEQDPRYQISILGKCHVKSVLVTFASVDAVFTLGLFVFGCYVLFLLTDSIRVYLWMMPFTILFCLCCSIVTCIGLCAVRPVALLVCLALRAFTVFSHIGLAIVLVIRASKYDAWFATIILGSTEIMITHQLVSQSSMPEVFALVAVFIAHAIFGSVYVIVGVKCYVYLSEKRTNRDERKLLKLVP